MTFSTFRDSRQEAETTVEEVQTALRDWANNWDGWEQEPESNEAAGIFTL